MFDKISAFVTEWNSDPSTGTADLSAKREVLLGGQHVDITSIN